MFEVKGNFICIFKTGHNIVYNLRVLTALYEQYERSDSYVKLLLCKPIILLNAAITEAILHDFHVRLRNNVYEGVTNITGTVMSYIQDRKIDEFGKYIASAKKHDFFDLAQTGFYAKLDQLRMLRNRVHIQNTENKLEEFENNVFTIERKELSEAILETVAKTMAHKYARIERLHFSKNFVFPWQERFPTLYA